jgi:hypothetical protein
MDSADRVWPAWSDWFGSFVMLTIPRLPRQRVNGYLQEKENTEYESCAESVPDSGRYGTLC